VNGVREHVTPDSGDAAHVAAGLVKAREPFEHVHEEGARAAGGVEDGEVAQPYTKRYRCWAC